MSNYPHMAEIYRGTHLQEVVTAASPKHTAFNSCIAWSPVEGYRLLIRDSGYCMSADNLQYFMPDPDGTIRTTTIMCTLDTDTLAVLNMERIDDESVRHVEWPLVLGIEDSRLYWAVEDGSWHRYGTIREVHWSGQCQIAEDWLDGFTVVKRVIHEGPYGLERTEKNWSAIIGLPGLYVYTCGPSQVYRPETRELTQAPWNVSPIASEFRGGSPAIPYGDGLVSIIHEVTWSPRPREYWHRFVKYDANGFVTHFTPAFYFKAPGIEFSAGLVIHRDNFVASFGFAEHRNLLAHFPIEEVEASWLDARL